MPFQRTVRAANTRTSGSGWAEAGGSRPALERSAVCQFTERSPSQYFAADTLIGTASSNNKTSTNFLKRGRDPGGRDAGSYKGRISTLPATRTLPPQATRSYIFCMSRAFVKDSDAD